MKLFTVLKEWFKKITGCDVSMSCSYDPKKWKELGMSCSFEHIKEEKNDKRN